MIIADGDSRDNTVQVAESLGATVLRVQGGRAAQLNAGARHCRSENILFLHADTVVPLGFDTELHMMLLGRRVVAGAFSLSVDSNLRGIRVVECLVNLRSRWLGRPYGDQGLFITREWFMKVGGYPNLPFLDDYEMIRQLSQQGRIAISSKRVVTSGRRWEALGVVRTTIVNQLVIGAYHIGVPVPRLRAWYRGVLSREEERKKRGTARARNSTSGHVI